jgi:ISXO2-like transposase domain
MSAPRDHRQDPPYTALTKLRPPLQQLPSPGKEYLRGDVTTNSAESYFALLKRGVHGTFHHISKEHLHRYCTEFAFRWTNRKTTDAERTTAALRKVVGKRLAYRAMKEANGIVRFWTTPAEGAPGRSCP